MRLTASLTIATLAVLSSAAVAYRPDAWNPAWDGMEEQEPGHRHEHDHHRHEEHHAAWMPARRDVGWGGEHDHHSAPIAYSSYIPYGYPDREPNHHAMAKHHGEKAKEHEHKVSR